MDEHEVSERRTCGLVGIGRSAYCCQLLRREVEGQRQQLQALAEERRRFGYRWLHVLVRREALQARHKRVYRLSCEDGLRACRRQHRCPGGERVAVPVPTASNRGLSMDSASDRLEMGAKFERCRLSVT